VSTDWDTAADLIAALHRTHARAEEALREAHALHTHGFHMAEVLGLDQVIWERDNVLFTRERALSLIWTIKEDS
jgi:hypothetical protein